MALPSGQAWYDAQEPTFRGYLDAFAQGINDSHKAHPESISAEVRCVLPVSGVDVVGHSLRVVHYMYMGSRERMRREVDAYLGTKSTAQVEQRRGGNNPGSKLGQLALRIAPATKRC